MDEARAEAGAGTFAARATAWAGVAAVAGVALAEAAAFAVRAVGGPAVSPGQTARTGGLLYLAFHGVPVRFDALLRTIGPRGGGPVHVSLGAAPTLGTLLIVVLLAVGGRRLARDGVGGVRGGLSGAAVAVPYGVACAIVAIVSRLDVPPPGTSRALIIGAIAVDVPLLWSAGLGMAVAAIAGFAGGSTASAPAGREFAAPDLGFGTPSAAPIRTGQSGRFAAATWAGAVWLALGLLASFAALLGMAVVDGRSRAAYFHAAFGHGTARGLASLGLTLLWLPTMCAWVLEASMGSCIATHAGCVLSYARLPRSAADLAGGGGAGPPPAVYLLFVLVPLSAAVIGGWLGARRAGANGAGAAMRAGVRAGFVFGILAGAVVVLARLWATISGPGAAVVGGSRSLSLGPAVLLSTGVGMVWGLVGGAAGGFLRSLADRSPAEPVRERVFTDGEAPQVGRRPQETEREP